MNNYQNHLAHECHRLAAKHSKEEAKTLVAEKRMIFAAEMLSQIEDLKAELERYYYSSREQFRTCHAEQMSTKQQVGEIQEELFGFAEAEESWHQ
ncbi:hypothetical protein N9L47_08890 [Rhodobacteraceae bacterium]|nr:hypothetical protein [Paracoccaceae bacterium]